MDEGTADGAEVIRIVIAEDHGLVAQGLSAMLAVEAHMEVIDVVRSGEALVASVGRHRPEEIALVEVKRLQPAALSASQKRSLVDSPPTPTERFVVRRGTAQRLL